MKRKTTIPSTATDKEAIDKGKENLNPDEDDEDENLDESDNDADENDEDNTDDSDEDDSEDEDELDQEQQDKDFLEANGFPPRTPEKDMTPEQALAYNKWLKKTWEGKYKNATKAFKGLTIEELQRLREVDTAHTELLAKGTADTDTDKAVADAVASVRSKFVPILVHAKFQALTSADEAKIKRILSRVNIDDFVSEDGDLDEDAIAEFAEDFFPVAPTVTKPRGSEHNGRRNSEGKPPLSDYEKGRLEARQRREAKK